MHTSKLHQVASNQCDKNSTNSPASSNGSEFQSSCPDSALLKNPATINLVWKPTFKEFLYSLRSTQKR